MTIIDHVEHPAATDAPTTPPTAAEIVDPEIVDPEPEGLADHNQTRSDTRDPWAGPMAGALATACVAAGPIGYVLGHTSDRETTIWTLTAILGLLGAGLAHILTTAIRSGKPQ
jgi:hypothetical protein